MYTVYACACVLTSVYVIGNTRVSLCLLEEVSTFDTRRDSFQENGQTTSTTATSTTTTLHVPLAVTVDHWQESTQGRRTVAFTRSCSCHCACACVKTADTKRQDHLWNLTGTRRARGGEGGGGASWVRGPHRSVQWLREVPRFVRKWE